MTIKKRKGKLVTLRLFQNLYREIKKTFTRFLSILAISALGVAFFAGIRATSPDMKEMGDRYFKKYNLSDITLLSKAGFDDSDIELLKSLDFIDKVEPQLFCDVMMNFGENEPDKNIRISSLPIIFENNNGFIADYSIRSYKDDDLNSLELCEGRLPLDDSEIVIDNNFEEKIKLGDYVNAVSNSGEAELRVVGFVKSVKFISNIERGTSTIGSGSSDGFAYASGNVVEHLSYKLPAISMLQRRYTQIEVSVKNSKALSAFSDDYSRLTDSAIQKINSIADANEKEWYVFDRNYSTAYQDYSENTERIAALGKVFPLIFFVVAALVCLTTMTRMVEDKRIEMGTLTAIGYTGKVIVFQYILYAILASLTGSILGCIVGFKVLPQIIIDAYSILYALPDVKTPFRIDIALISIGVSVACTTLSTLWACSNLLSEVPASLMRPKPPKAGKKTFIEHITFLWKQFNFTTKVTIRNILRYKKRFYMSVIGIAGSCGLLITAFGLNDSITGIINNQFGQIWHMDIQAFAYQDMPYNELANIIDKNVPKNMVDSVTICENKLVSAGYDGEYWSNVYLMTIESNESLNNKISFISHNENYELDTDGVIVTQKFAEAFDIEEGGIVDISINSKVYQARVSHIVDNYVYNYIYLLPQYYEKLFENEVLYNGFLINTNDDCEKIANMLLNDKRMYSIMITESVHERVVNSLNIMTYVITVLTVGSAMLTFVVMFNLTNINITERKRELATLSVLGFYDKEMYDYIFRENNTLSVIGAIIGLLFGKVLHTFVIKTVEVDIVTFSREIQIPSYIYGFVLTIIFSLAVNFVMRKKIRSINMVESLKSAE